MPRLRVGGLLLVDNMLWSGTVVDPDEADDETVRAIMAFNDKVAADDRVAATSSPSPTASPWPANSESAARVGQWG